LAVSGFQVLLVLVTLACGQQSVASQSPTVPKASPTPSATASPAMGAADMAELAKLEARPMRVPLLRAGQACHKDTMNTFTNLWGVAPVYVMGGPHTHTSWGDFYDVSAFTKPGLVGPVLLRGRDLKVPNHPIVFIGPYATGKVFDTEPTFGPLYTDLAFDTAHPPSLTYDVNGTNYIEWEWRQGIASGWTGCISFQVDGPSFTEVIAVNVPTR
jgi:hypothetical protein